MLYQCFLWIGTKIKTFPVGSAMLIVEILFLQDDKYKSFAFLKICVNIENVTLAKTSKYTVQLNFFVSWKCEIWSQETAYLNAFYSVIHKTLQFVEVPTMAISFNLERYSLTCTCIAQCCVVHSRRKSCISECKHASCKA